jgi:acyl dehydratase
LPFDESSIGRVLPSAPPYQVSRAKIREFATAVGEFAPVCHNVEAARAAGYADLIAPPTFPVVFTMSRIEEMLRGPGLWRDLDLGWRFEGTVHGGQKFEFHRPVQAGDELECTIEIADFSSRAGTNMLTLKWACTDAAGEPVCVVEALLLTPAEA